MQKPKEISWKTCKKKPSFNCEVFHSWNEHTLEEIQDFLTDPANDRMAKHIMHEIRTSIRKWIRSGKLPKAHHFHNSLDNESMKTQQSNTTVVTPKQANPTNLHLASSSRISPKSTESQLDSLQSADTPLGHVMRLVSDFDTKMINTVQDVKNTICKFRFTMQKLMNTEIIKKVASALNKEAKEATSWESL